MFYLKILEHKKGKSISPIKVSKKRKIKNMKSAIKETKLEKLDEMNKSTILPDLTTIITVCSEYVIILIIAR